MTHARNNTGFSAAKPPTGASSPSASLPPSKLYLIKYRSLPHTARDFIRFWTVPGPLRYQTIDAIFSDYFGDD
jgi:hypothetical protein